MQPEFRLVYIDGLEVTTIRTRDRTANKSSYQYFITDSLLDTRRNPTARRASDDRSSFKSGIGILGDVGDDILEVVLRQR